MKKKMLTGNDGFTLIEVILSIAILALISVPLINYFTDSMKYAVKTQEKQNATLVAQDTLEFLKAQEFLMEMSDSIANDGSTVKHYNITNAIKNRFGVPLSQSLADFELAHPSGEFDKADGKGTLKYDYSVTAASGDQYDLRVILSTDTGVSEIASVVEEINDQKSVVASEYNEMDTAIMEMLARNAAAVMRGSGGYIIGVTPTPTASSGPIYTVAPSDTPTATPSDTPTPSPVAELTEDEIRDTLQRTVHVELGMVQEVVGGGVNTFYTVRVYYEYECPNVSTMDPLNPDVFVTSDIVNTNVAELEGVYLMFNKCQLTSDVFEFEWVTPTLNPPNGKYPEIRMICQDLGVSIASTPTPSPAPTASAAPVIDTYTPHILFKNFTGWTGWNPQIRTNLESPSEWIYDTSSSVAGTWQAPQPLTDSGSPVRVFKISVDVYRKGERDVTGKDPIVTMITSKTE